MMRRAVFLDKDGTLIEDVPYNVDPGRVVLAEGCEKALDLLRSQDYELIVVSNQPGIAKGFFEPGALLSVEERLKTLTAGFGVLLEHFYYCPHHPEGTVEKYRKTCSCRKPEPGLILQAARELGIDPAESWMIGDILNDVEAGRRAGCRTILLDNGNETEWHLSPERMPHRIASNLAEAAYLISRSQPSSWLQNTEEAAMITAMSVSIRSRSRQRKASLPG